MSFFTQWDFYYIPMTDNCKYINYKTKLNKKFDTVCISPTATSTIQNSPFGTGNPCEKRGPWYDRCKYCSGDGWAYMASGNYCWRSTLPRCPTGRYNYNGLCYSEGSACKPEMIGHQDDFNCKSEWNTRDLNVYMKKFSYYNENVKYANCTCTGACYYGVKQVCEYDPNVFKDVGGIGSTQLIKTLKLLPSTDSTVVENGYLEKLFVATVNLTRLTWEKYYLLRDIFQKNSKTKEVTYLHYLNTISLLIAKFYLMMNVQAPTASIPNVDLTVFKSFFPVFMVFRGSNDAGIITATKATTINYARDFYAEKGACCNYNVKTIDISYVTLGSIQPASEMVENNTTGIFIVKPIQLSNLSTAPSSQEFNFMPAFKTGDLIIYLIYYRMSDFKDQNNTGVSSLFQDKYLNHANLSLSPQCRAWNEFVWYNHVLPNICYQKETNSAYCQPIVNYDDNPPTAYSQNCSLVTSSRFPDCRTYLLTNREWKQPLANPTRTDDQLSQKQFEYCNNPQNNTLECQCYNRDQKTSYQLFGSNTTSFPVDMKSNAGCWYRPCLDDPNSNIFIPSEFLAEKRNCPSTVCQSVITVMNRPENSANISNLDLRSSCTILSSMTPRPKTPRPTIIPTTEEEQTQGEDIISPSTEEESVSYTEDATVAVDSELSSYYQIIGILIILFIVLVASTILIWMSSARNRGINAILQYLLPSLVIVVIILLGVYIQKVVQFQPPEESTSTSMEDTSTNPIVSTT